MEELKISIIVPIFNAEHYLDNCIQSIIQQTYSNFEVLLIDDGSTDYSFQLCKQYETDRRIHAYRQTNAGVSAARNKGIELSSGKYIWFIDADDWVEPETLADFVRVYEQFQGKVDVFSFNFMKHLQMKTWQENNLQCGYYMGKEYWKFMLHPANHFGLVWSNIYSADIIKNNNIRFDEKISQSEDIDFSVQFNKYINTIFISKNVYYHYRITNNSLSRKYNHGIADSYMTSLKKLKKNIMGYRCEALQNDFEKHVQLIVIFIVLNDYYHPKNRQKPKEKYQQLMELLREPLIAEAMKKIGYEKISKDKWLLLHLIKQRNSIGISLISRIRYLKNSIADV